MKSIAFSYYLFSNSTSKNYTLVVTILSVTTRDRGEFPSGEGGEERGRASPYLFSVGIRYSGSSNTT